MGLNVLVTGGAGYIGSHACKALDAAGHFPVTYDNLIYGHRWSVKWGPLVIGDLDEAELLRTTLARYNIEAVMHFAAHDRAGESIGTPGRCFHNNVVNSLGLLDAMVEMGVHTMVFSSSCATYGLPMAGPIGEEHPQRPVNPYGESKLFIERALQWYSHAHGIHYAALRYFNAAGADLDAEIGEVHDLETHLIPQAIEAALSRNRVVRVYGTDYPTPDGSAVRDYVHVVDLADAHVSAMERLYNAGQSFAVNLGTGQGHSVLEVINAVEQVSELKVSVLPVARRPGDPPALVARPGLAEDLLGWQPQCSELEMIVATALQWQERQWESAPRQAATRATIAQAG